MNLRELVSKIFRRKRLVPPKIHVGGFAAVPPQVRVASREHVIPLSLAQQLERERRTMDIVRRRTGTEDLVEPPNGGSK